MKDTFAVVLGGGHGTRLWPLSRRSLPKQFLDLAGDGTLLTVTISRLMELLPIEQILVATIPEQADLVRQSVPGLPADNLIIEPVKRGTGPCIVLATLHLEQICPEGTMLIVPSDHLISDSDRYLSGLTTACEVARSNNALVTIGLEPLFPATKYGYIQIGKPYREDLTNVFHALRFVEKPEPTLAEQLFKTGGYFWNTGTFSWTLNSLRLALQQFAPQLYGGLETIRQRWQSDGRKAEIRDVYETLPDISIDYALMEKADDVLVVRGEFRRTDIGDLNALAQIWSVDEHQTAGMGKWVSHNSKGNIVYSPEKLVALVGVKDSVVVVTDDVVLICPKEQSQAVRELVEELKTSRRDQYL